MAAEGDAAAASGRRSVRRLRLASLYAPAALILVVAGPGVAGLERVPVPVQVGQPLCAALGAVAAIAAVRHADVADDLSSVADQNLRVLVLLLALVAIAIAGAWLWLGAMNLTSWLLGSG